MFEQGAFADRALHGAAAELDARDRALATTLVFGTVQRLRTLDHVLARFVSRPLERLEPAALAALRLGAFQMLFLDRRQRLRRGRRQRRARQASQSRRSTDGQRGAATRGQGGPGRSSRSWTTRRRRGAAILHSVPDWLAELWWRELGAEEARRDACESVNEPAESAIRVNTLRARPERGDRCAPGRPRPPAPELPEGLVLDGAFDAHRLGAVARRARSCRSRGHRCWSRECSHRKPASAFSISAPRPAARRPTWRR